MRQRLASIALVVLAASVPAAAQEQATVVKRDGTRVSGRFEAWNRNTNTLYIRVSLGDQQIIPLGQAAVVDVEGNGQNLPETELGPARGGDHVLVLRTGDVIRGRLTTSRAGKGPARTTSRECSPSSPTTPASAGSAFRKSVASTWVTSRRR